MLFLDGTFHKTNDRMSVGIYIIIYSLEWTSRPKYSVILNFYFFIFIVG